MNTRKKPLTFIVDDVKENIQVALSHLTNVDCDFAYATSGEQAIKRITSTSPQLILMDVVMPGMNGYQTVQKLKENPTTAKIPVIFLTAKNEPEDIARGFESGGVDYITKPFSGDELRARINTWLELASYRENLEHEVEERTKETQLLKQVVIEAMGELAEFRDPETGAHIKRTQHYVKTLAEQLFRNGDFPGELDDESITLIYKSAPLHDIGKVGIADSILLKPGKLTAEEFTEMQNHTLYGQTVIKKLEKRVGKTSFLKYASDIIVGHHEKYDGSGYPHGLKEKEIPLSGKIMAIADVYDALTSKRVYKEAFPHEKVMAIMNDGCGSHFDPIVFNAFLEVEIDFRAIAAAFEDEELIFS